MAHIFLARQYPSWTCFGIDETAMYVLRTVGDALITLTWQPPNNKYWTTDDGLQILDYSWWMTDVALQMPDYNRWTSDVRLQQVDVGQHM